MQDRLKITREGESFSFHSSQNQRKLEQEARFERIWLHSAEKFNPLNSILGKNRIDRTLQMLSRLSLDDAHTADIGCGWGVLSQAICREGAECDACDIAANALKRLPKVPNLHPKKTALPKTDLTDDAYDIVLCCDTIAELDQKDYRLAIAELSRILKSDGKAIISTPIDLESEDAIERFLQLLKTEFTIIDTKLSYHGFYIKLRQLMKLPDIWWRSYREPRYRQEKLLDKSTALAKGWFRMQSALPLAWFWGGARWISVGLRKFFLEKRWVLLQLEAINKFLWDVQGVSHLIVLCKRKPLTPAEGDHHPPPDRAPFFKEKQWE